MGTRLGLKENLSQFVLLVIVNAFVGGMIGLERSVLPGLAAEYFEMESAAAVLSFILVFGMSKAVTNLFSGTLAGRFGRKNILIAGWLFALPVPFILMHADTWMMILFANVLLGISQGLTWSLTVVMKIDLVGSKNRGFAMGLNEFAGYLSIALTAWITGEIAENFGYRPYPFYFGIAFAIIGFLLSLFLVKDTTGHAHGEAETSIQKRRRNIFLSTSIHDQVLGSVTQAGLVNNLNDGMVWGLLPVVLLSKGFSAGETGLVAAVYPAVWGIGQLITGKLSDRYCKRNMMYSGMLMQGMAILMMIPATSFIQFALLAGLLGWGTAMVYPVFLAAIAENTHPLDRAKSLGIFRFWRDLGYALGALLTGLLADAFGLNMPFLVVGLLTLFSARVIYRRMQCKTEPDPATV